VGAAGDDAPPAAPLPPTLLCEGEVCALKAAADEVAPGAAEEAGETDRAMGMVESPLSCLSFSN
jgi:hypothetical protein